MQAGDVSAAADLANAIHLSYPEDPLVIRNRLALYPEGCFVLTDERGLYGHLVCHPWKLGEPPALNAALEALPESADCLYLHDITLAPAARGHGHARLALDMVLSLARKSGLGQVFLMAVGEAHGFWERAGFSPCDAASADPRKGYGPEARAYIRPA